MKNARRLLKRWRLYGLIALLGYPFVFLVFWLKNSARHQLSVAGIGLLAAIAIGFVLISFAWGDLRKR